MVTLAGWVEVTMIAHRLSSRERLKWFGTTCLEPERGTDGSFDDISGSRISRWLRDVDGYVMYNDITLD